MLNKAEEIRPQLPVWDLKNPESVDEWKQKSAMQAGFDLCLAVFKPSK